ncbi:MAG: isopenicillin N synthase family oxygenase [Nannocystaceae bacterium]|nr:isopenicillin N synthase family oxygenase [Nannocystaceae bacterium]
MADASIPVISLHDLAPATRTAAAVKMLGEALETFGFVAITDHGVPEPLLTGAYAQARALFELPPAAKQHYEDISTGRQRGYTSLGVEHAKGQTVPDMKEFWHVGRRDGDVVANVEPAELPEFAPTFNALFDELDRVATTLLTSVGSHLGKPDGFFEDFTRGGNSVIRVIHYPPLPDEVEPGAVRAAAHEDINLMTVLPVATEPGLQLMTREGEWIDVQTPPNVMVCDSGDMLQLLTEGRIRSTTHRVVNPPGDANRSRYSMPFFCHPRNDARLSEDPEVLALDFLMERLRDIGVA